MQLCQGSSSSQTDQNEILQSPRTRAWSALIASQISAYCWEFSVDIWDSYLQSLQTNCQHLKTHTSSSSLSDLTCETHERIRECRERSFLDSLPSVLKHVETDTPCWTSIFLLLDIITGGSSTIPWSLTRSYNLSQISSERGEQQMVSGEGDDDEDEKWIISWELPAAATARWWILSNLFWWIYGLREKSRQLVEIT